jgi:hypothetical protein
MYEVNVKGRIIDKSNSGISGISVALKRVVEVDNIRGTRTYSSAPFLAPGTDANGYVFYSGISVGVYDAIAYHTSGTFTLYNIEVKNEYPVVPGGSEDLFENRSYIRSLESVGPSGIMVEHELTPIWPRYGSIDTAPPAESGQNAGYVTNVWEDRIDGVLYSGTLMMSKELGDRSYHSNQATQQVKSFVMRITL